MTKGDFERAVALIKRIQPEQAWRILRDFKDDQRRTPMNPPRRPTDSPEWGGKRERAGRPPKSGERRLTIGVNMLPSDRDWLDALATERAVSRSEMFAAIIADYRLLLGSPEALALLEALREAESN